MCEKPDLVADEQQEDTEAAAQERLAKIAEALGCSADAFSVPGALDPDLVAAADLMRYWSAIKSTEKRQRVLELARALALSS